jgi:hypothetical protein
VTAANAANGKPLYTVNVYSGRTRADGCAREFANRMDGYAAVGDGNQMVVDDVRGHPQKFDLVTGKQVWVADRQGVPLDGSAAGVLVRDYADEGALTFLDMRSGQARWNAPDPGLSGASASWATSVGTHLVAVSGATGESPFVIVYDAGTGKELGRYRSWLEGAGEAADYDWVAVQHGADGFDKQVLEFYKV